MMDELSHDKLIIKKVLNNDLLREAIEELSEPGVINLIDENWEKILKNNVVYQKHADKQVTFYTPKKNPSSNANTHINKYNIVDRENFFQILVAGYFRVENGTIISTSCKPILEIGNVMCTKKCLENCKFYMFSCGGYCPSCQELDIIPEDHKWCVTGSKVFTPKEIKYAEQSYIEKMFKSSNIAIVRIDIVMKYYFGVFGKIGGNVKSIIFVQESLLGPIKKMNSLLTCNVSAIPRNIDGLISEKPVLCIPQNLKMPKEKEEKYEVNTTTI